MVTGMDRIEQIRGYIRNTKMGPLAMRYDMSTRQYIELVKMAVSGKEEDAVLLAYNFGRAQGLRMGRAEARAEAGA